MNDHLIAPGYVLHARPYRETSLLMDLLVLDVGKIGAIARGVRGPRGTARRAVLQPLQPLNFELRRRGELAQLVNAEAASAALHPKGDALLAALYVNELCQRLLPRDEPQPQLFWQYAACLGQLESGQQLGLTLRRFELQLLAALGYAVDLQLDAQGAAIDAASWYLFHGEFAAERVAEGHPGAVAGRALLTINEDSQPLSSDLGALRRMTRRLLEPLLGGRPLRCWGLIDELGRSAGRSQGTSPAD